MLNLAYMILICSINILCQFYVYIYAGILLEDMAFNLLNFDVSSSVSPLFNGFSMYLMDGCLVFL